MPAPTFEIIAEGCWSRDQVCARWVESSRPAIPQVEQAIERSWASAIGRRGVNLFDGSMCRLESWEATEQSLTLNISPTSYKVFFGTNLNNAGLADRFGRGVFANPVGVSAAVESADGFVLLGHRSEAVAYYPGRVHPFAGTMEPSDTGDVFSAVTRELGEELSLCEPNIRDIHCLGIVEDRSLRQPELIFHVKVAIVRDELVRGLDAAEHRQTWAIQAKRDAIERAIADPILTPVACATLVLWERNVRVSSC